MFHLNDTVASVLGENVFPPACCPIELGPAASMWGSRAWGDRPRLETMLLWEKGGLAGVTGVAKQSAVPCCLLLKESSVIGENYGLVEVSPERERRGKWWSWGNPAPPRALPSMQAPLLHVFFFLPSTGLLWRLPLSLSFPESDHIHFGILRDSQCSRCGVLSILLIKVAQSASVILGYHRKVNKATVCSHRVQNRSACIFVSKYTWHYLLFRCRNWPTHSRLARIFLILKWKVVHLSVTGKPGWLAATSAKEIWKISVCSPRRVCVPLTSVSPEWSLQPHTQQIGAQWWFGRISPSGSTDWPSHCLSSTLKWKSCM